MRRAPGWTILAMTALELAALALVSRLLSPPVEKHEPQRESAPAQPKSEIAEAPAAQRSADPGEFVTEFPDQAARYYRAADDHGEVLAAFYGDGRVRLADREHRFAGLVSNSRADLLEIDDNTWSELLVRESPEGRLQLELRGGPFDARVLTCEAVREIGRVQTSS